MEVWRKIEGFKDYEISNIGRVKSLKYEKEKILKTTANRGGYYTVFLRENNKTSAKMIHQIIAIAFLNHKPNRFITVVDHIDNNKLNNNVENLQLITARENSTKDRKSEFTGVQKKINGKFQAKIKLNGKNIHLGMFKTSKEAGEAYQKALLLIKNNIYELQAQKFNVEKGKEYICFDIIEKK